MPPPFARLDVLEFSDVLQRFPFTRSINMVHVHHTWRPNHAQYRGHSTIEGMWRHHTQVNGWRDIAQHVSIGPGGEIWLGRNWNLPPASAAGHNGNSAIGPFMIEVIGDFDIGKDVFAGAQRDAVLKLIVLVHERFDLPPTAVMFHNMMSTKTCPGSSVEYQAFLEDVGEVRLAAEGSRSLDVLSDQGINRVENALAMLMREVPAARGDESMAEHEAHDEFWLQRADRGGFELFPGVTREMLDALRPHVINLRGGRFSTDGLMTSSQADVDGLIERHLEPALERATAIGQPLRILLYAHGGLVSESAGLQIAHKHLAWWKANGIYPINFVWETGLWEAFGDLLRKSADQGERSIVADQITDPIVEAALRVLPARAIWRGMKLSAMNASAREGGASYTATRLKAFCDAHPGEVELHAVGHSAGSIFHCHLLPLCRSLGLPSFRTVQLLAPAVRVDHFMASLATLLGQDNGVDALTMFTMASSYERDDHCFHIYRKSLLYLVSASAEEEVGTPLLGLEDAVRADAEVTALFGLGAGGKPGPAEVLWAKSSATEAISHGGFDDDPATLASVVRNILGRTATDPVVPYAPLAAGGQRDAVRAGVDWPEVLRTPRALRTKATTASVPGEPALSPGRPARRFALCIGINTYTERPLSGCVRDAQDWGAWLEGQGFTVAYLLDHQATAGAIRKAIEDLLNGATRGDVVVIQFAGHGTQIADLSGDEQDQYDEAWVPVDYRDAEFILDDTLGEFFDRYRGRGVELVLFTDCCHSGSNTRAAFSADSPVLGGNSRYLPISTELQREFNARYPGRVKPTAREGNLGWEIHYAACQDEQSAYEENGHGKFTLAALAALRGDRGAKVTYGQLADDLRQAFAGDYRQTPHFRATADKRARPLFAGPKVDGEADVQAGHPGSSPVFAAGQDEIRRIADELDGVSRRLDELSTLVKARLS